MNDKYLLLFFFYQKNNPPEILILDYFNLPEKKISFYSW